MFTWTVQRTKDGGKTLIPEVHYVLPIFRGLKLPIFDKFFWRELRRGRLSILDSVTRDEYIYQLWGPDKGKFVSVYFYGAVFSLLKESREFHAEYQEDVQKLFESDQANELAQANEKIDELNKKIDAMNDTIALLSKCEGGETALAANLDQVRHFAARRTIESLEAENARLKERLKNV